MCTAVSYQNGDHYFGRTLDYDISYSEQLVFTPRKFPLPFRNMAVQKTHYAILGMGCVQEGYPLYFDGFNEKGLAMAGLNFAESAHYKEPMPERENIASFEFIPWILSQCASVQEAKQRIERINLTNIPFSDQLPPAGLHWILADRNEAITVESVEEGIRVYPNPVGVLTNEPPFDEQMFQLNNYMHLSSRQPRNHFSEKLDLRSYSRGMGALGLPGDLSSQSRFVRAAFVKMNSVSGKSEAESVSQFFHILGSVDQVRGCCEVEPGKFEITMYTSCCNTDKGIYYYTTYENRQISAVDMHRQPLDEDAIVCYPLNREARVFMQN